MKRLLLLTFLLGCQRAEARKPTLTGPTSIEAVGRVLVTALARGDRKGLEELFLTLPEYATFIYPELVKAHEPLLESMGLQWAWDNLEHSSRKDLKHLLYELGGKKLAFKSIETAPNQPRGDVSLYPKVVVHAELDGQPVDIRAIFAVVARDGHYRVLRYRSNRDD